MTHRRGDPDVKPLLVAAIALSALAGVTSFALMVIVMRHIVG